ncbi:hypothetical protein HA50_21100 [Pantoea cypripedii]|uniref:Uncharacterized protein n=1 Tax=Pantoea cypripedii TaxID=55209 RepID=A0A1X1EK76_PANCY|nr:hypothetical protein HA50_21100 [Pantoea cypripedii]
MSAEYLKKFIKSIPWIALSRYTSAPQSLAHHAVYPAGKEIPYLLSDNILHARRMLIANWVVT